MLSKITFAILFLVGMKFAYVKVESYEPNPSPLVKATKSLKDLHSSIAGNTARQSQSQLSVVCSSLNDLTPSNIPWGPLDLVSDSYKGRKEIKDYAVNYMQLTSDLLDPNNVDFWGGLTINGTDSPTPSSLLNNVDEVLDFSLIRRGFDDVIGTNGAPTSLLFDSAQMNVRMTVASARNQTVNATEEVHHRYGIERGGSSEAGTNNLTVISALYKNLPALMNSLIGKRINQTTSERKVGRNTTGNNNKNNNNNNFNGTPCDKFGVTVTDSLCFLAYKNPLDQPTPVWSFLPQSNILSVSVYDKHKTKLSVPVKFQLGNGESNNVSYLGSRQDTTGTQKCVFYNVTMKKWSDSGCQLTSSPNDTKAPTCYCNHTTNFAILVLIPAQANATTVKQDLYKCSYVLQIVSIVSGILSEVFLVFSISFFAYVRRFSQRNVERNTIHMCLASSMFFLHFVLLVDEAVGSITPLEGDSYPAWSCFAIAAITHYLLLCNFAWMSVEGILLYVCVVRGSLRHQSLGKYKHVIGWLLPGVIAGVTLVAGVTSKEPYVAIISSQSHQTGGSIQADTRYCVCYLSYHLSWAAFIPMVTFASINVILSCLVVAVIARLTKEARLYKPTYQRASTAHINTQTVKNSLSAICKLYPILGLMWVITIVAPFVPASAYCYVEFAHVLINGMQGVFLFLVTILHNGENRALLLTSWQNLRRNAHCVVDYLRIRKSSSFPTYT